MGHLVNPISLRLGINKSWRSNTFSESKYKNVFLTILNVNLNSFLERFFSLKIFLRYGFLFSHYTLVKKSEITELNIYLYKTIKNKKKNKKTTLSFLERFLAKLFYHKVRIKNYKKISFFISYMFNFLTKIFSIQKINQNLNLIYNIFQLKKNKFFLIEKYYDINLLKSFGTKSYFEHFFLLLFRRKFWNLISRFIYFYLNNYLQYPIKINFYTISNVNVNIIRKYISIRLRQRFKISQIITPVIKDLKKKKRYCRV